MSSERMGWQCSPEPDMPAPSAPRTMTRIASRLSRRGMVTAARMRAMTSEISGRENALFMPPQDKMVQTVLAGMAVPHRPVYADPHIELALSWMKDQ